MKKLSLLLFIFFLSFLASAQELSEVDIVFVDATELNIIGKVMDTPNPYDRVDTVKYKGFTKSESEQVRCPSGIAVVFRTNSRIITIKTEFGGYNTFKANTMPMAYRGYDLYIRKASEWVWAGARSPEYGTPEVEKKNVPIVQYMDKTDKDCLLYLPIYTEVASVKIGVEKGSHIEPIDTPFRHRIAVFGSSYTQGISVSRSGMTYPAQFTRHTGIQLLSLGCSGNCKLQPYFAAVLCDADVEAFLLDTFSNPTAEEIDERLFPFIETIQKAHPGKPLIFQQTIYRERRNFNHRVDSLERTKIDMAEKKMKEAIEKYKDIYFIHPAASVASHESMVDGTHPDDYGYYLWSKSIEKPVLEILKKYGIE